MARFGYDFSSGVMGLVGQRERIAAEKAMQEEAQIRALEERQMIEQGLSSRARNKARNDIDFSNNNARLRQEDAAQRAGFDADVITTKYDRDLADANRTRTQAERATLGKGLIGQYNSLPGVRGDQPTGRETVNFMMNAIAYADLLPDGDPAKAGIKNAATPQDAMRYMDNSQATIGRAAYEQPTNLVKRRNQNDALGLAAGYGPTQTSKPNNPGATYLKASEQGQSFSDSINAYVADNPAIQRDIRARSGVRDDSEITAVPNGDGEVSFMVDSKNNYAVDQTLGRARLIREGNMPVNNGERVQAMNDGLMSGIQGAEKWLSGNRDVAPGEQVTNKVPLTMGGGNATDEGAMPVSLSKGAVDQIITESQNAKDPNEYVANMWVWGEASPLLDRDDFDTIYAQAYTTSNGDPDKLAAALAKSIEAVNKADSGGLADEAAGAMAQGAKMRDGAYTASQRPATEAASTATNNAQVMQAQGNERRMPAEQELRDRSLGRDLMESRGTDAAAPAKFVEAQYDKGTEKVQRALEESFGEADNFWSFTDGGYNAYDVAKGTNEESRNGFLLADARESITSNLAPWKAYFGKETLTQQDYAEATAIFAFIQKDAPTAFFSSQTDRENTGILAVSLDAIKAAAKNNAERLTAFRTATRNANLK